MGRWPKPPEGSWTRHYPELGTGPISFADCVAPEFYELEREAIFKRAWLNVGRVEDVPRVGSYVTREIEVAGTSLKDYVDGTQAARPSAAEGSSCPNGLLLSYLPLPSSS